MAQVQWLKLYIDIFDNEKIKKLLRNRDGDSYFRAWIQLLILAGKSIIKELYFLEKISQCH